MEGTLEFLNRAASDGMLFSIVAHIALFVAQLVNICDVREYWVKKHGIIRRRINIMDVREEYLSISREKESRIANMKILYPVLFFGIALLSMVMFNVGLPHILALHLLFIVFRIVYIIRVIFDNGYALFYNNEPGNEMAVKVIRCNTLSFYDKRKELGNLLVGYKRLGLYYVESEDLLQWYHKNK